MKKNVAIMLLCIILLSFSSCKFYFENVSFVNKKEGSKSGIIYQNKEYSPSYMFTASKTPTNVYEDDIKIGMYYSFPFTTYCYSYTDVDPIYIYSMVVVSQLYLREDYDYHSEIFLIEGTSDPFVFSEAFIGPSFEYSYSLQTGQRTIVLYAQEHPRLKSTLLLFSDSEKYWVVFPSNEAYLISPLFLDILEENGIIEK